MDKYLKRLCNAILDGRFNDKNYRTRKSWHGYLLETSPRFSSYGTIGFDVSIYDEKGHHLCDVEWDGELRELTIDEMDWKDRLCTNYLEENDIYSRGGGEYECYTPGGEDMFIYLESPNKEYLQRYIDDFDIDEKVVEWWRDGKADGVPFNNIKEHYEDYEEYLKQLQEICDGMPY